MDRIIDSLTAERKTMPLALAGEINGTSPMAVLLSGD